MTGTPVTMENGRLNIPNDPVIHYIEGDGIGVDITPVMIKVVDASVSKAYGGSRGIVWSEVLAGEKAFNATGEWLPEGTRMFSFIESPISGNISSNTSCPIESFSFGRFARVISLFMTTQARAVKAIIEASGGTSQFLGGVEFHG